MSASLKIGVILALFASIPAWAMPVGVRLAMQGRIAAQLPAEDDPFPVLDEATPEQIAAVLSDAVDSELAANIVNAAEYAAFRTWAQSAGAAAVKASTTSWLSYALGVPTLVPAPQEGDLTIEEVQLVGTQCEVAFSLKNVNISPTALEARLKTVFGVEGASVLEAAQFSPDNLEVALSPTEDGRVKASVEPKASGSKTFFIRIRLKGAH